MNIFHASTIRMAAASTEDALQVRRLRRDSLDRGYFPPIHGLATEVLAEILAWLDSSALSSAILAHPLFHGAFQLYQQRILKDILRRLIPPRLLPLALATYEAASIDYSDGDLVRRLLDRPQAGQAQAFSPWPVPLTRRVVAAMERVHLMVQYFTADLAQQAIPRFNRIFETARPETSSPSEELRILRAFYRFQLYCNIFGRKSMDTARKATRPPPDWPVEKLGGKSREEMRWELECFFWPWPPWVNEQLACVFEYLEATLSVFFDNVASHDVEWGWRQVDWVESAVAIPHRRFLVSGFQLHRALGRQACLLTNNSSSTALGSRISSGTRSSLKRGKPCLTRPTCAGRGAPEIPSSPWRTRCMRR